jgi:thioredoxin 1
MQRLDQFTFYPVLADTPGPALVFFSAASCGSCRHWKQVLNDYAATAGALPVFEVDAGLDQALAQEFELYHLPALFVFVDGEFHRPLQCAAGLAQLRAAIAATLAQPAEEAP